MLPQSHKIISEFVYENVRTQLGIELDKSSLIYGSIKPDFAPHLAKLDHFKPQIFDLVLDEIHLLSQIQPKEDSSFMKAYSENIGIVTHFIADFFCLPHNDRVTYRKATIVNHIYYEQRLHKLFKDLDHSIKITPSKFKIGNETALPIKGMIEQLHREYQLRGGSMTNDLISSLHATSLVALYIVYHGLAQLKVRQVA